MEIEYKEDPYAKMAALLIILSELAIASLAYSI